MDALSIILVHSQAAGAHQLLTSLAADGLVHPCIVTNEAGDAVLLDHVSVTPVVLEEYLARQRPQVLRLVHLVIAVDGTVHAVDEAGSLRDLYDERCRAAGITFSSATIVVPHVGVTVDPSVTGPLWTVNAVVAPEDSGGSRGMMAIQLAPDRTEPMAVAAALTVGGAWSWMPEAPIDRMQPLPSGNPDNVRMLRLAVRTVDGGDLTTRVIDWALEPGGAWPLPPDVAIHGLPQQAIQQLASPLAAALGFQYVPLAPRPVPAPKPVGVIAALRLFITEMSVSLRAMPGKAWVRQKKRLTSTVEGFVQQRTFGADSDIAVSFRGASDGVVGLLNSAQRIQRVTALPSINEPAALSTPDVWNGLLSAAFGVVDGGSFTGSAGGLELQWQGRRAVVTDRSLVAPAPDDALNGFPLSTADVALLTAGESAEEPMPRVIGSADATSARLVLDRLAHLQQVEAAHEPGEQAVDGIPQPPTPMSVDDIAELRLRLGGWVAEREGSLVWKLGKALDASMTAAAEHLGMSEQRLTRLSAELEEYNEQERRHLKRRRRRFGLLAFLLFVMLIATITGFLAVSLVAGLICLAVFASTLLLGTFGILSTAREEVRLKHRLAQLSTLPEQLIGQRQHAANELGRLSYLNDQLIEWAEIISCSLHQPWGGGATSPAEQMPGVSSDLLAFTRGIPDVDDEGVQGEIVRLRRRIAHSGWIQSEFVKAKSKWRQRYEIVAAVDPGEDLDPAADVSTSRSPLSINPVSGEAVFAPRVQLADDISSGRFAAALREAQVSELRQVMAGRDADRLIDRIRCDIPGLSGTEPQEFLASLIEFSPLPPFSQRFLRPSLDVDRFAVAETIFGISETVEFIPPQALSASRRIPVAGVEQRFLLAAFRLDLSRPLSTRDIRAFGSPNIADDYDLELVDSMNGDTAMGPIG
jgi:hypothetical protein